MATEEVVMRGDDAARPKISWSAIFAGTVFALALWILLYVFGMAAGLTALDPQDPSTARAVGIGTGIWSVVAALIALGVGGYFAANLANVRRKGAGAEHGAVLWGLCTVLGIVLLGATIGQVVGAAGQAAAAGPQVAEFLDITAQDAVEPLNERLREEGKPTVTAAQLRSTMQDAAGTAVREGRLDREVLMGSIVRNTQLDRQDAEALAATIETRVQEAGLTERALQVGEDVGKALWWVFLAMVLGLLAAILGGVLGARRGAGEITERRRTEHHRDLEEEPRRHVVATTTSPTRPAPGGAHP
jgi:hypothetical protein